MDGIEAEPIDVNRQTLPFFFGDNETPVLLEPIFLPLVLILVALVIGFCLVLPGIRGRERIFLAIRYTLLGSAGIWMIFSFFCTEWIVAETKSTVNLWANSDETINSTVKLQIGFVSGNISLGAEDPQQYPNRYWNERFYLTSIEDDLKQMMENGIPEPILTIASHFSSTSSRISLLRTQKFILFCRLAISFQIVAVILWVIACGTLSKTITTGGQFMLVSGLSQIICSTLIAFVPRMIIHLPGATLETTFGWCWSLNLGMGLFGFVSGILIQLLDCFAREPIRQFFDYKPWEEEHCPECEKIGKRCMKCESVYNQQYAAPSGTKSRYESETARAVRQLVNGGNLYPKAITLRVDNEKSIKSNRTGKSKIGSIHNSDSALASSISASIANKDQTLSYGDWTILEAGNFGTERHVISSIESKSPSLLKTLDEIPELPNSFDDGINDENNNTPPVIPKRNHLSKSPKNRENQRRNSK